jgi:hypothetical protein
LNAYFSISRLAQSDKTAYGLDSNQTVVEYEPLVVNPVTNIQMKRAFYKFSGEKEGDDGRGAAAPGLRG